MLETILERARWAPSGDNTQPWRFEIAGEDRVVVHGRDTRDTVVYDLDGHASQLAIGGLLETAAIAASVLGRSMRVRALPAPETRPTYELTFVPDPQARPDPLAAFIETRSVHRRPLSRRPLTAQERRALEASVASAYGVAWVEGTLGRRAMARLLFRSARLRLTTPEAYRVHRSIIAWNAQTSEDRVPDQALGVDPMTLRLMRFALQDWQRVTFMNRWMAGTWIPRVLMDVLPALHCAAHFALTARQPLTTVDEHVTAGRAMQRFWLTATSLGLQLQPEMTPLIFARYARRGTRFTEVADGAPTAAAVDAGLAARFGRDTADRAFFLGRLGHGPAASARSTRLPLQRLLVDPSQG